MLKGRLKGYAVGLVQLFREVPCPDQMARHLLERALEDFCETGHHRLMCLVAKRDHAMRRGTPEEVTALSAQIHEHAIHEQIPRRWQLDFLFSPVGYATFGEEILWVWAAILIQICTLEQHWERVLLGYPPRNPHLLPGFHPDKEVFDTAWLEEARRTWSEEIHAEAGEPGEVSEPDEGEEELHVRPTPESDAAGSGGPWVN